MEIKQQGGPHGTHERLPYAQSDASEFHETLEAAVAGALVFTRREYVIRLRVIYAFTDRWKRTVGADIFRGNRRSFFANLRDNTTAYAEFRWNF